MDITSISGVVSHVQQSVADHWVPTQHHGPVATTVQVASLRLNGKPVVVKTRSLPSIADGDKAIAAGTEQNGTFVAYAFKNLTSGASYYDLPRWYTYGCWFLIAIGIPLIPVLGIGLFFIYHGVKSLRYFGRVERAIALVDGAT